jgi:hypothetical protein
VYNLKSESWDMDAHSNEGRFFKEKEPNMVSIPRPVEAITVPVSGGSRYSRFSPAPYRSPDEARSIAAQIEADRNRQYPPVVRKSNTKAT